MDEEHENKDGSYSDDVSSIYEEDNAFQLYNNYASDKEDKNEDDEDVEIVNGNL